MVTIRPYLNFAKQNKVFKNRIGKHDQTKGICLIGQFLDAS